MCIRGGSPVANDVAAEKTALGAEVRHWRRASIALTDLEVLASPGAWLSLESYLGLSIRSSLRSVSTSVVADADHLSAALAAARTPADLRTVRAGLLNSVSATSRWRRCWTSTETPSTPGPTPGSGPCCAAWTRSPWTAWTWSCGPWGSRSPGPHLPGQGHWRLHPALRRPAVGRLAVPGGRHQDHPAQPVAPTSLVHETAHQVAHLTGWNKELAAALYSRLSAGFRRRRRGMAELGQRGGCRRVCLRAAGYAPAAGAGHTSSTARPHGVPDAVRRPAPVALGAGALKRLCRSWFGPGPWDDVGRPGQPAPPRIASREVEEVGRAAWPSCGPRRILRAGFGCGPSAVPITAFARSIERVSGRT